MWLAQAAFGSVGWRHERAFAYRLPVRCVQTGAVRALEHYATRMHRLTRVRPACPHAASHQ
eukprot:6451713-Prymnesium_polylepis.1